MKRVLLALAVLTFAGAARGAEDAAATFAKRCAACHGPDGKGKTPMGQRMGVPDLTTLKDSETQIANVVTNGKGKMPAFKGKLSDEEIKAVSAYTKNGLKK